MHPVTDAQHRNAQLENAGIHPGTVGFVDAGRPAGKNDAFRRQRPNLFGGDRGRFDLAVDTAFADPTGNELIELGSEIDDDDHGDSPS
jgi:hypothetical protein